MQAGVSEMDLLVNDLSLHGQFPDLTSFRDAVRQVMEIRRVARHFGRALYCSRNVMYAQVSSDKFMQQAVQALTREERSALTQWLTQHGPFWDDVRHHGPDDWFEHEGQIVTDSAIGEAAWCCISGIERGVVSFTPSDWLFSPLTVEWKLESGCKKTADVANHWSAASVEAAFQAAPAPLGSWSQLEEMVKARCTKLTFAGDTFFPIAGYPFVPGAAQRLLFILDTLNRFKSCFDADGQRTTEGHEIYQNFFTGTKGEGGRGALFSDSSDTEKGEYEKELTFKHPDDASKTLFCSWHAKVQTPPLRVHFSWPIRADQSLYVVYVGPKITKQ